jgi:hypothetical protein
LNGKGNVPGLPHLTGPPPRRESPGAACNAATGADRDSAHVGTDEQDQGSQNGDSAQAFSSDYRRHPLSDRGDDLYQTPPVATRALLRVESLPSVIWEPACGPGSIVGILREHGHRVIATDLVEYFCPDSTSRVDFPMEHRAPEGVESIVTNPPYKNAEAFVAKALQLVPKVVMLLRLAFLESERRRPIIDTGDLARVYVFRNRLPMMHREGWTGPRASSAVCFAWFVWERGHAGPTVRRRISWEVE